MLQGYQYLRDSHARVREVVCARIFDVLVYLVFFRPREMLDVASSGDCIVVGQISDFGHIRMRNSAVITLVVIIGQCFPVIVALHAPRVIELVLSEVKLLKSLLPVDTIKVVLPGDGRRRRGFEIDPNEPQCIDMDVHWEQTLVLFLELRDSVKSRGLSEFSVQAVRPAMILAREDTDIPFAFGDNGEPAMPADIVEAIDGALTVDT